MSDFRPCAIIPTYDNPATIRDVVARVRQHLDHVIIVDDGSHPEARQIVASLGRQPGVTVVHRAANGGKGAAMKDGLRAAHQCGFSHGLQIDADGQHDVADVPRLLAAAKARPTALVLAQPEFDSSAPKARRYGRKITVFWTSLEAFGSRIGDPLCGFRVYPLALALAVRVRANRMDYDPEIAVRLVWAGAEVVHVPTQVRYFSSAQGGVSHFHLWQDNILISWMHTRLVLETLLRLLLFPFKRLLDKTGIQPSNPAAKGAAERPWYQIPEAGSRWGVPLLTFICKLFGRKAARALLPGIVLYYVLARNAVRNASRDYLARVAAPAGFWDVHRHVLRFAQCSLDRLFFLSGEHSGLQITQYGHEHLTQLRDENRGALLLGAHLGSFEALRTLSRKTELPITTLAYFENAPVVNAQLSRAGANRGGDFLPLEMGGIGHTLRIKELVQAGELVAILADRNSGKRAAEVEFLNGRARFPLGPFAIAAALECPVFLTLALYTAPDRYELICEPLLSRVPKRSENPDGLVESAQAFATRLEFFCRRAPDNWFNFYDFWAPPRAH